jgi:outer membrane protein OmpA-like peptidoglycan-associated protein
VAGFKQATAAVRLGAAVLALGLAGCGEVSGLETQARILAEPPCTDFFFPVYFAARSAELSPAALRVIRNAGRQAQGCRGPKVEVVGLAGPDQPGSAPALSRERARRLAEAFHAAGLPPAGFQANAFGAAGAARPAPERRRIDVYVRFQH